MSNNCKKCGVSEYRMGMPFCTDEFCKNNAIQIKKTPIDDVFDLIQSIPSGRSAVSQFKEFLLSKKPLFKHSEKDKLKDAWKDGRPYQGNVEDRDAEQWYNETYGGVNE
jgi:hypothetical protein